MGSRARGAARNRGAAAAKGSLLAFTDADCEPAPSWLSRGLACLEEADLVQGAVRPTAGSEPGPFDHTVTVERRSGLFETANLLIRRDLFQRLGGFEDLLAIGRPAAGRWARTSGSGGARAVPERGSRSVPAASSTMPSSGDRRPNTWPSMLAGSTSRRWRGGFPELRRSTFFARCFLDPARRASTPRCSGS